ncbi:hypothetical protein PR048_031035 [Dryococelus australis]|uniref:DDE Tnp4 domain-containing protein n=1 Tax=Dryococelus australis TaxID=614101 RepID=A0ABQ9G6Z5_9NEOP|nr:hypothetical protein PR048_031035 [Dryococelus australis]
MAPGRAVCQQPATETRRFCPERSAIVHDRSLQPQATTRQKASEKLEVTVNGLYFKTLPSEVAQIEAIGFTFGWTRVRIPVQSPNEEILTATLFACTLRRDMVAVFRELWGFPNCIDRKQMKLKYPAGSGSIHHFWKNIPVPHVLIGDEEFSLDLMIHPFPTAAFTSDTIKRKFNSQLSRARRVVENAFSILVEKPVEITMKIAESIVKAACLLRNYIRRDAGFTAAEIELTENTV